MSSESAQRRPSPRRATPATVRTRKGARAVLKRPAVPQGWDTSDEHEIELRRWRGRTEITAVEALERDQPIFGAFRARSDSGSAYDVEIRSLDSYDNLVQSTTRLIDTLTANASGSRKAAPRP